MSLNYVCVLLQEGNTALHASSYFGNVDIVHMLLQAGADANIINKVRLCMSELPKHICIFAISLV